MSKATYAVILFWLFSASALAQGLLDAPLPAAISLVKENGSLDFRDDNGMSLYTSDRDPADQSLCDRSCAKTWLPVAAPRGERKIGDWTPVRRPDNSFQWAYKGKPVYTYKGDAGPGQASGAGKGGMWRLLKP